MCLEPFVRPSDDPRRIGRGIRKNQYRVHLIAPVIACSDDGAFADAGLLVQDGFDVFRVNVQASRP